MVMMVANGLELGCFAAEKKSTAVKGQNVDRDNTAKCYQMRWQSVAEGHVEVVAGLL